jgi:hypothetical protein
MVTISAKPIKKAIVLVRVRYMAVTSCLVSGLSARLGYLERLAMRAAAVAYAQRLASFWLVKLLLR